MLVLVSMKSVHLWRMQVNSTFLQLNSMTADGDRQAEVVCAEWR